uniref:Uncharacterized protein n=1 Tax=Spongospora subterranea TaxID=70186 RepID=A0A0H5QZ81_9EUKA|eukprot:CRZ00858.1 hypothetical protein [Spongospora subterranea]
MYFLVIYAKKEKKKKAVGMYFLRNHNASPFISRKSDIALEIWAVICTNSFIDFSLSNFWSGSICRAMFSFCLLLNSDRQFWGMPRCKKKKKKIFILFHFM